MEAKGGPLDLHENFSLPLAFKVEAGCCRCCAPAVHRSALPTRQLLLCLSASPCAQVIYEMLGIPFADYELLSKNIAMRTSASYTARDAAAAQHEVGGLASGLGPVGRVCCRASSRCARHSCRSLSCSCAGLPLVLSPLSGAEAPPRLPLPSPQQLTDYMSRLVEEKSTSPKDDIISQARSCQCMMQRMPPAGDAGPGPCCADTACAGTASNHRSQPTHWQVYKKHVASGEITKEDLVAHAFLLLASALCPGLPCLLAAFRLPSGCLPRCNAARRLPPWPASQLCTQRFAPPRPASGSQVAGNATVASMVNLGGWAGRQAGSCRRLADHGQPACPAHQLDWLTHWPPLALAPPSVARRGGAAGPPRPAGVPEEGFRGQGAQHGAGGEKACPAGLLLTGSMEPALRSMPRLPAAAAAHVLGCLPFPAPSPQICRYHTASALALRRVAKDDVPLGGQTIK